MNNTEQFDEWIREEMDNLDSPPENFRQADIWQKLQTELHPVSEKKSFLVRRIFVTLEVSKFRVAVAAAVLLFLVGGIWWKIQPLNSEVIDNQVAASEVISVNKQPLVAAKKKIIAEKGTLTQQVLLKKLPQEKSTKINLAQAPSTTELEQVISSNNDQSSTAVAAASVTISDASPPTVEVAAVQLPEVVLPPETKLTNLPTAKNKTKPKFKIVHANELTDYQKVELAEAKEKEAKAKGIIVINWHTNVNNQSENGIMSYLKKKNVTTTTVIVE